MNRSRPLNCTSTLLQVSLGFDPARCTGLAKPPAANMSTEVAERDTQTSLGLSGVVTSIHQRMEVSKQQNGHVAYSNLVLTSSVTSSLLSSRLQEVGQS